MKLEVGKKYTTKNGIDRECIAVTNTHAWLKCGDTQCAYVWTIDGKAISLSEDYDLKPQPREFWLYGGNNCLLHAVKHEPFMNRDTVIHVREVMPE